MLRDPLHKKNTGENGIVNPYEIDKLERERLKNMRKTVKIKKDQQVKEIKREVEALTSAVGFKGQTKSKATEVMLLNSKVQQPTTKKERRE
jgi:hypothetical protein